MNDMQGPDQASNELGHGLHFLNRELGRSKGHLYKLQFIQ